MIAVGAQPPDSPVEIDLVAVHDGGDNEAQARHAETLILKGAIPDFALTMKEHHLPPYGVGRRQSEFE